MKKVKRFIVSEEQMRDILNTANITLSLLQNYDISDFALEKSTRVINAFHDIYFYMCCYDDDIVDISSDIKYALLKMRVSEEGEEEK